MCMLYLCFFFFKQKTAYEMRISDWSSDVGSSDLAVLGIAAAKAGLAEGGGQVFEPTLGDALHHRLHGRVVERLEQRAVDHVRLGLVRDQLEQVAQALARIGDGFQGAEH